MSHVFALPIPRSKRAPPTEEENLSPQMAKELQAINAILETLRSQKLRWEDFLQRVDLSDPLLRLGKTREADTILHLAVIQDQKEVASTLMKDRALVSKRNCYGFTALELAHFLHREKIAALMETRQSARSSSSFYHQTNIYMSEGEANFAHLTYLHCPIFESPKALYDIFFRLNKARVEDRIPTEKIWMGIYFDKEIRNGTYPPISIRFIDKEVGYGAFTEQKIPSCAFVGEYTGVVQERKRRHIKDKLYCVRYTTWDTGRKNFVIDAEGKGNFTRFINHSQNPNLSLQSVHWRGIPRMIFIALKDIAEGTQLTFDYGNFFWKECPRSPRN